jgi:DNA polymerase/3'-5' exonuclease PolX
MFITICGSYRRELPTSSDIDILLTHMDLITNEDIIQYNSRFNLKSNNTKTNNPNANLLSTYVDYLHKQNILIDDITDKNIKTKYMGFGIFNSLNLNKIRRIDIRLIPMVSYWPALLYFTGSYDLNQTMRLKAKKLGYKLNEYGLYDLRTEEMIVVTSEQEIFEKLEINYIQPNQR